MSYRKGEKVRVLDKTRAVSKESSGSWKRIIDQGMVAEVIYVDEREQWVELASDKDSNWVGEYNFSDIAKLNSLTEAQEL